MKTMNTAQKEKIKETAETIINERYKGAVGIDLITIIPDVDMHGEDFVRVIIVFDEDNPNLGGGAPNLTTQISDYLYAEELPHFPVTYYIGKSEWPEYKKGLDRAILQPH